MLAAGSGEVPLGERRNHLPAQIRLIELNHGESEHRRAVVDGLGEPGCARLLEVLQTGSTMSDSSSAKNDADPADVCAREGVVGAFELRPQPVQRLGPQARIEHVRRAVEAAQPQVTAFGVDDVDVGDDLRDGRRYSARTL